MPERGTDQGSVRMPGQQVLPESFPEPEARGCQVSPDRDVTL
jgi:hypothetical protein